MAKFLAAVDVGTGSARAGIFDSSGRMLARAERPITLRMARADHAEQDSADIWRACGGATRAALEASGVAPGDVAGISFDATCSIVVRDASGAPVGVSLDGPERWDTIVWLDHRAQAEAAECTASGHRVIDYVGGVMSPEMAIPKLMWLKRRLPAAWSRAGMIFDLTDFLTWKATGSFERSQCTLTSKWTYLAHEPVGWRHDFLAAMGLDDLMARAALPEVARPIGGDLGPLTAAAAAELGLTTATRVASGLIDAHAGALGVLGHLAGGGPEVERHMALIAGTSSCVMAFSHAPRMTSSTWGPYLGVALPDLWMNEGGQSVSGALLDHICKIWGGGADPTPALHGRVCARIAELRESEGRDLAGRLHVVPDFHGNRSPLADPSALGVISGLSMDASFDGLCRLYWRTSVAVALGLRHILERMNESGYVIDTLNIAGGHTRNPVLMELYADVTGCRVMVPSAPDAVLLGTAMAAAVGAGVHPDLVAAGRAMHQGGALRSPNPDAAARFERDWRVFRAMHRHRAEIDAILAER
ncbi:MAG: FGGY-family carbohydrate kinase [Amaricoccus sp.]|uniref:FGGY-family carbohydrate kinase n=1 Tax=Amaricoccus sp. TaxID=1872485 RepID=UPI003315CA2D